MIHQPYLSLVSPPFLFNLRQGNVYDLVPTLKENHVGDNQDKICCADPETISPRHYSPLSIRGIYAYNYPTPFAAFRAIPCNIKYCIDYIYALLSIN